MVTGRHQYDHFSLQITLQPVMLGLGQLFGLGLEAQVLSLVLVARGEAFDLAKAPCTLWPCQHHWFTTVHGYGLGRVINRLPVRIPLMPLISLPDSHSRNTILCQ